MPNKKKILVLGSGGREHAIAWKLKHPTPHEVFLEPGNAGTQRLGFPRLEANGLDALIAKAKENQIDLVVIGPEVLLEKGYADTFRQAGFLVAGPNQAAARLETSKVFSKEFMKRAGIPTAAFSSFDSRESLKFFFEKTNKWPWVLKLDGLAAGKGVVIAHSLTEVTHFCDRVWNENEFGPGPHEVLVEEFIQGKELSYIGLCDGHSFIPLATSTDHKRIGNGNTGANTGGMGCVSPSPFFSDTLENKIQSRIVTPLLDQLQKENLDYRGALYIGIMIDSQEDPYVLEFNARFGDPETQTILLKLESDLYTLLEATAQGSLSQVAPAQWSNKTSVYVVATAHGYPSKPRLGDRIRFKTSVSPQAQLFYSGVNLKDSELVTGGGRVLGIGALGSTVEEARKLAYTELEKIDWNGIYFRTDIGVI